MIPGYEDAVDRALAAARTRREQERADRAGRRDAIGKALAIAVDLLDGQIEHHELYKPDGSPYYRYECPECHKYGWRPFAIIHALGCAVGSQFGAVRRACEALAQEFGDEQSDTDAGRTIQATTAG